MYHDACIKHDSCFVGIGQNGDNSTTFPIISSVGDFNPVDAIFSGRSLSSANTCIIANNNQPLDLKEEMDSYIITIYNHSCFSFNCQQPFC